MLIQDVANAEAIVAHKQGKGYSPVQKTLELMEENGYLKKEFNWSLPTKLCNNTN